MAAFGPRSYETLLAESCWHLKMVGKEALAGDQDARKWLLGGFGHSQGIFYEEFWQAEDGKPISNMERLDRQAALLAEKAQHHMQALADCQAAIRDIAEVRRQQEIAPLALEIIARRRQWEVQQAEDAKRAQQEKYAEELHKQQEATQDYQAAIARQHQERAQRETEAAERKRRELAPYMQ